MNTFNMSMEFPWVRPVRPEHVCGNNLFELVCHDTLSTRHPLPHFMLVQPSLKKMLLSDTLMQLNQKKNVGNCLILQIIE